jgi:hypothetical protein
LNVRRPLVGETYSDLRNRDAMETLTKPPAGNATPRRSARATTAGCRRLDEELAEGVRDVIALIRERYEGKARRSRERVFLAIHEHSTAAFAQGRPWASAERQFLADHAGVHIRTFDAAVHDLVQMGLVVVVRRRLRRDLNLPNLWRSRPVAAVASRTVAVVAERPGASKLHTRTTTLPSEKYKGPLVTKAASESFSRWPALTDARGTTAPKREFRWLDGPSEHPVLHGLPLDRRWKIADAYETVRERLLDAGVRRVPEGGWLAAIRDYVAEHGEGSLALLDQALDDFIEWREYGGSLCYSFGWMHRYRRSPCPPPSLLFGISCGDEDDHSGGEAPLLFWINGQRNW